MIPGLALLALTASPAPHVILEVGRSPGLAQSRGDEPPRRVVVIATPEGQEDDGGGGRSQAERRLSVAERMLDRAAAEIEEGRPGRALGMIRAARAVMRGGPRELGRAGGRGVGVERRVEVRSEAQGESHGEGPGTVRLEIRTKVRNEDGTEDEKVEVREFPVGPDGVVRIGEGGEGKVEVRVGTGPVSEEERAKEANQTLERATRAAEGEVEGAGAAPEPEEAPVVAEVAEAEKPVGIGVLLEVEDGAFVVREVLPESPAAREGSIKPGDRLVGAYDASDEAQMFDGKPLEEVVGLIRGGEGTKVKLIVEPAGGGDRREVELERQPLDPSTREGGDGE